MQQTNIKVATYVPSSPRRGIWAPMIAQTQTKAQFRQKVNLVGIGGEIIIIIPAPPAWSVMIIIIIIIHLLREVFLQLRGGETQAANGAAVEAG